MLVKKLKFIFIILILYQTPLHSKSKSFNDFNANNLSKYFSGIVALENKNNSKALDFFNSSKILLNRHDTYLKKYVYSLVLENKVTQAINVVRNNRNKNNSNFFDAYLLLILDSLKKKDLNKATLYMMKIEKLDLKDRFHLAIFETLKQYIYTFKEKKILDDKKNFGKLSLISETFQRCYLGDQATSTFFENLFNDPESDYTRYIYFYLTFLIENKRIDDAKKITADINYIDSTLLLSQGKSWIENKNPEKLVEVFSCKNSNDIVGEFLFLISNLYSTQNNFYKSNFYLNLSNFLNPKFLFNLSLVVENQYLNEEYKKAKKSLENFKKDDNFYYWYRVKKEAQIIAKLKNKKASLDYITTEFNKIDTLNNKILYDIANFYKNSKDYKKAIKYY